VFLYHGTDEKSARRILKDGVNPRFGRKNVDFGQGFYTTPNRAHAEDRARIKAKAKGCRPALIIFSFEEESAIGNIKRFYEADLVWLQFIVNNRMGIKYVKRHELPNESHNRDAKYDIVIGETADAGLAYLIWSIKDEDRLVEEDDLFVASNDTLGVQYSFHTQNGLSFIAGTASMELI